MATEVNNNAEVPSDQPYYEKLANEEEMYLEETEEDLRSRLISDARDDRTAPSIKKSFELPRQTQPDRD